LQFSEELCKGQNGWSGQGFKEMSQAECDAAKAKLKDKKSQPCGA
jgi:hypothetical protein